MGVFTSDSALKSQPKQWPHAYQILMKALYFALLMLTGLVLAGCTTTTTTSTQTQTDQTKTRVHTQEELRKSGETETGPALEKTDAAIRTSGPR
jgi:hypothetical protein